MEKINELQKEIVSQALDWLYKKEPGVTWEEKRENTGEILNELKKTFGFQIGIEAWCAMFGWGIINQACKVVGAKNNVPKTAGAKALLTQSKATNVIIVKDEPDIGALMYRKSADKKATGHIGVVVKIDTDGSFYTIEGNVDDKVGMVRYIPKKDTAPRYFANGGEISFMWAGRQPYTGKARNVSIELVEQKVVDTTKSKYVIGSPQSDTNLPNTGGGNTGGGNKKGKRKRRAFA
jgi:hypothetical protein